MKKALLIALVVVLSGAAALAQSNKIIYGPRVGNDPGVLTVHNGEHIEIEMWVRTDPENPNYIIGVAQYLMSDTIIASRNGAIFDDFYSYPCWDTLVLDPRTHDDDGSIPEGYIIQAAGGLIADFYDPCNWLDTNGEWDYYASFLMTCATGIPEDDTYYPFSEGWIQHSNQGSSWSFQVPPGGSVEPEEDYCGLYFAGPGDCVYIPGDCNHNGMPVELSDVIAMIGMYRGTVDPYYSCDCPPHGGDFAPEGDPNGNCVAFELGDAVTEVAAYRGTGQASSCPECPGSGR